jgi:putative sterol carrier protein
MTFVEKFNELKAQFPTVKQGDIKENFAIQVNMTDDECGGVFYIANIDGVFSVEPYDYRDHTALITASADFLTDLAAGKAEPVKAFMLGKVQADGNFEHIKLLAEILKPKKAKKAPAKKEAAADGEKPKRTCRKKTEVKTEAPAETPAEAPAKKTTAKKTSKK